MIRILDQGPYEQESGSHPKRVRLKEKNNPEFLRPSKEKETGNWKNRVQTFINKRLRTIFRRRMSVGGENNHGEGFVRW